MLQVVLLGQLRLTSDGRPLDRMPNPRLLTFLLLHRERALQREEIAFALWPDSGDAQALTNLRREIHTLRHVLPDADGHLELDRKALRWRPSAPAEIDVDAFERAVERGRAGDLDGFREAISLYGGDLVPGIYDDWITPSRERLRNLRVEAITGLAGRLEERREYGEALGLVRILTALDPLDEVACRTLLRLAILAGDRSAGVRAYRACADALQIDLGVAPSAETTAFYRQVLALGGAEPSTRPAAHPAALHRLIGRETEWATLTAAWSRARAGESTLVLLQGEAGIGKSKLIEELVRWAVSLGYGAAYARSYAAEGALPYAPVAAWFRAEPLHGALPRLADPWLTEISRLLPELVTEIPRLRTPAPMTETWERQRLFEALARGVRVMVSPMILVLDDAHWADQDTLEWLHYLLRADPRPPVLVIVACRSEDIHANPALRTLVLDARERGELDDVDLGPLSEGETNALAADIAARPLDDAERAALFRESEGHPLIVVELARAGLAFLGTPRDGAGEADAAEPAAGARIPPRVRAVVAARLERLSPDAREVAALAAVVGRRFEFEALSGASDLEEASVARAVDELWQRRILRDAGSRTFDFSHDRIREVAYAGISPARRRLLHRRIAQALELRHATDLNPVAGELAAHYEAADQPVRAIDLYDQAAVVASHVSADNEEARHLSRALSLLALQPAGRERDLRELGFRLRLSPALLSSDGYASERQEQTMERAVSIAEALALGRDAIPALDGLFSVRIVAGEIREAAAIADVLSDRAGDVPELAGIKHITTGGSRVMLGRPGEAIDAFRLAVATYHRGHSLASTMVTDIKVFATAWCGHALWLRGLTSEARQWASEATAAADAFDTPYMRVTTHSYAAMLAQFEGDADRVGHHAGIAGELCRRYRLVYYTEWNAILEAWAAHGRASERADRIKVAIADLERIRGRLRRPYYLSLLAQTEAAAGDAGAARDHLETAIAIVADHGEGWWLPEIHRLLGDLETDAAAERDYRRAIDIAREQGSSALALRAAISLASRIPDTRDLLAAILAEVPDPGERERAAAGQILGTSRVSP